MIENQKIDNIDRKKPLNGNKPELKIQLDQRIRNEDSGDIAEHFRNKLYP